MPELPEVETIARALAPSLIGREIQAVWNDWPKQIAAPKLPELNQRIAGRRFESAGRRGKYLVFSLDQGETLLIHLKMTGNLSVVDATIPANRHVHTSFALDSHQELRFRDMRKFGRVYLLRDPDTVLDRLGPEPLEPEFTAALLQQRLENRKRALKPLLLDQGFVAGVGNIYADEALHHARLHPQRPANSLSEADVISLHAAIQSVLRQGIEREGASIDSYVKPDGQPGDMQNAVAVFRRTGQSCYRCGGTIERIILGGRSTHYCPSCQL